MRGCSGRVLFSDDGALHGASGPGDVGFRTAARGGRHVELAPDPAGGASKVIRVTEPIT